MNNKEIIKFAAEALLGEANAIAKAVDKIGDDFAEAVKVINRADKLIVTGVGKSGIIAKKISATFSSVGIPAVFLHPSEALHGDLGIIQEGDAAILLSKSGGTEEIVNLTPFLRNKNIPLISIVGNMDSYLARSSDYVINATIDQEVCPLNLAPTSSTTLTLAIGDAMAVCSMKLRDFNSEDFSKLHPFGQLGRNTTILVKDIMHTGDNLPKIVSGSTFKDALILISKKGLGCVCVVDSDNRLIGIVTDGDVRRILENYKEINGFSVDEIMTKSPISILEDIFIGEALSIMERRKSQISVLPVVDTDRKCIGLIRVHDIIRSKI